MSITCPAFAAFPHLQSSTHKLHHSLFRSKAPLPAWACNSNPKHRDFIFEIIFDTVCIYIYIFITIVSYSANWHPMPPQHLSRPKKKASLFKKSIWWSLLLDYCEIKIPHILAGPHGVKRKIAVQSHTSQNIKSPCVLRKEASQRVVILKATSFL